MASSSSDSDSSSSSKSSRDSRKQSKKKSKESRRSRSKQRRHSDAEESSSKRRKDNEGSNHRDEASNHRDEGSSHRDRDNQESRADRYKSRDSNYEHDRHDNRPDKRRYKPEEHDRYKRHNNRDNNRFDRGRNFNNSRDNRDNEGGRNFPNGGRFRNFGGGNNRFNRNKRNRSRSNSIDHATAKWGKQDSENDKNEKKKPVEKQKINFGTSGKLTEETNTYCGVVIKYSEPPEARKPKRRWRLYPFKGEKALQTLYIHRESAYLIGRERKVVDLPVDHPSCSKQHAVLQYRLVSYIKDDYSTGKRVRPYIIDLDSANGTYINNKKIESKKYIELLERDVIKFGFSSREYVLLHENSKDEAEDDDVKQEEEDIKVKVEAEK